MDESLNLLRAEVLVVLWQLPEGCSRGCRIGEAAHIHLRLLRLGILLILVLLWLLRLLLLLLWLLLRQREASRPEELARVEVGHDAI